MDGTLVKKLKAKNAEYEVAVTAWNQAQSADHKKSMSALREARITVRDLLSECEDYRKRNLDKELQHNIDRYQIFKNRLSSFKTEEEKRSFELSWIKIDDCASVGGFRQTNETPTTNPIRSTEPVPIGPQLSIMSRITRPFSLPVVVPRAIPAAMPVAPPVRKVKVYFEFCKKEQPYIEEIANRFGAEQRQLFEPGGFQRPCLLFIFTAINARLDFDAWENVISERKRMTAPHPYYEEAAQLESGIHLSDATRRKRIVVKSWYVAGFDASGMGENRKYLKEPEGLVRQIEEAIACY